MRDLYDHCGEGVEGEEEADAAEEVGGKDVGRLEPVGGVEGGGGPGAGVEAHGGRGIDRGFETVGDRFMGVDSV